MTPLSNYWQLAIADAKQAPLSNRQRMNADILRARIRTGRYDDTDVMRLYELERGAPVQFVPGCAVCRGTGRDPRGPRCAECGGKGEP